MLLYGCDLLGFFGFYWQKAELRLGTSCHSESGPAETRRVASVYTHLYLKERSYRLFQFTVEDPRKAHSDIKYLLVFSSAKKNKTKTAGTNQCLLNFTSAHLNWTL